LVLRAVIAALFVEETLPHFVNLIFSRFIGLYNSIWAKPLFSHRPIAWDAIVSPLR